MGGINIEGRDLIITPAQSKPGGDYDITIPPKDWKGAVHCGWKISQTTTATTFQDICVDGDWGRIQLAAQTYGTVNMTITQGGIGGKTHGPHMEPVYQEVFFDNIAWKIRVNKQVCVPTIIRDILRDAGYVA